MANELMNRFGVDPFFDGLSRRFFDGDNLSGNLLGKANLKTDITENDKDYEVKVDVPGIDKKDIHLDYQDGILSINVNKETASEKKDEDGKVIASERSTGMMSRSYQLPGVDRENVSAKLDDGVLSITLPKMSENDSSSNGIEIQ